MDGLQILSIGLTNGLVSYILELRYLLLHKRFKEVNGYARLGRDSRMGNPFDIVLPPANMCATALFY